MVQKVVKKKESVPDRMNRIREQYANLIRDGTAPHDAVELLDMDDYDFFIDHDGNFDDALLTKEQQKTVRISVGSTRVGMKYNKADAYPKQRKDVYNLFVDALQQNGATVETKENFRDLLFVLGTEKYRVILEQPRKPKK